MKMEDTCWKKAALADDPIKMQQYRARAILSNIAFHCLRNSNSTSQLERSFSQSLDSLDHKRYKLRNVFECLFYKISVNID